MIGEQVCGSDAERIDILPGHNLQLLKLENGCDLNAEHYYVYLCGYPKSRDEGAQCFDLKTPGRPKYYVPVKVPVADNAATDQADLAYKSALRAGFTDRIRQAPVYHWYYRPEYQFSAYELKQLQTEFKPKVDDQATPIDLLTDGFNLGYQLEDENLIDVFQLIYDVVSNSDAGRLPVLGQQPDLTLAVGEQTYTLTPNPTDEQSLLNLLSNDKLKPEDFLTIRLYQNNDTANILWSSPEKLYAYYRIRPDEAGKHLFYPEEDDKGILLFRVLGGLRIQLGYMPYADEIVKEYKWTLDSDGARFMTGFEHDAMVLPAAPSGPTADKVFIEPIEWALKPEEIDATLIVTVVDQNGEEKKRTKKFKLVRRELKPNEDEPMQGSDVAMLEELLWQLGISPQLDKPGSEGARIGSVRFTNAQKQPVWTQTCAGQSVNRRDTYYPGWAGCADGRVSTEAMVRRFQARNATRSADDHHVTTALLTAASGQIDADTLSDLKRDWQLYRAATEQYSNNPVINPTNDAALMNGWVAAAVNIWDNGIGTHVPASTYTADTHNAILRLAGLTPMAGNNRNAFLKSWITHESSHHWGGNFKHYQETPFRMEEGGADERGSLSFSQLLYGKRFGKTPCAAHDEADLNLYEPGDNVKTFVVHTASDGGAGSGQASCKGLIYRGFYAGDRTLDKAFSSDTGSINKQPGNVNELKGYRHNGGSITTIGAREDNYDVLAKAVMGYNGGEGYADNYTWAKFLKYKEYRANSNQNTGKICHSCRYSIEVRQEIFGNNLRTFIWQGGMGLDVNGNGSIADIPDDPATPKDEILIETTVPWCFEFGEKEWISGKVFNKVKQDAAGKLGVDPIGRVSCD